MSQEDVRQLLQEIGGGGSVSEVATQAKKKYPDRTLHTYVGELLRRLKEKGFVTEDDGHWSLTKRGSENSIEGIPINDTDLVVTEQSINDAGLEIVNVVATIDLDQELNLYTLSEDLPKADYNPESSPFMIFRPSKSSSVTLLVPTNGRISVVGAKGKQELIEGTTQFFNSLANIGIEIRRSPNEALVQNIVITGDLGIELELSAVAVGLGLEQCEYEPEQFPGLIYRMTDGSTALVFRTGKYLINGAKSYAQALDSANNMRSDLADLGIEFDRPQG